MLPLLRKYNLVWLLAATSLAAADPIIPARTLGLQLSPDTTVVTAPLDAQGYPDYLAALTQRLSAGVSREENFWVLMWPVIGNAERSGEWYIAEVERQLQVSIDRQPRLNHPVVEQAMDVGPHETRVIHAPWTRADFPEFAAWLDQHAADFDQIHAACARPKTFAPLVTQGDQSMPMVAILLPHVQSQRHVARLLAARSMYQLGEGRPEAAWHDLLALHRLAQHTERGFTLIEALVGYAVRSIALQATAEWIARCELAPEELDAHWQELEPLLQPQSLARAVDSERFLYLDTVLALTSHRASAREMLQMLEPALAVYDAEDGTTSSSSQLRSARELMFQLLLLGSEVNETLRYGNVMYDELIVALQPETHAERAALLQEFDQRLGSNSEFRGDAASLAKAYLFSSREELRQLPGRVLTGALLPAITNVETACTRAETFGTLLRGAFMIQRQLAAGGELPLNWNDLVPSAATDLTDPFDAGPLRLRFDARGLMLYSVGPNGIDDRGQRNYEGSGYDDLRVILPIAP